MSENNKEKIKQLLKDLSINTTCFLANTIDNKDLKDFSENLKQQHHSSYEIERNKIKNLNNKKDELNIYFSSLTLEELYQISKKYNEKTNQIIDAIDYLQSKKAKKGLIEMLKYSGSGEMREDEELIENLKEKYDILYDEKIILLNIIQKKKNNSTT